MHICMYMYIAFDYYPSGYDYPTGITHSYLARSPTDPHLPPRPQPSQPVAPAARRPCHPQLITPADTARHTAAHLYRSPHARSTLHPQPVTPTDRSHHSQLARSQPHPQPISPAARLAAYLARAAVASRPASPQLQLHSHSLNHRI